MPQSDTTLNSEPLSVFISYFHRDEDFKDELVVHLATLKRQGKIRAWQDRDIEAGAEWDAEIQRQLESADVILLLITPYFIASDHCYDQQMQQAIQRHHDGTARVIPILLKPCDWKGTPFSKLQPLPKDAKPVTKWDDQDEAFLDIVQGIRKAVESLSLKRKPHTPASSPDHPSKIENPKSKIPARSFTPSIYNPNTWVERTEMTGRLLEVLRGSCRILALVGITGIGKTALAERLVAELTHPSDPSDASPSDAFVRANGSLPQPKPPPPDIKPFRRLNLDEGGITSDFASSGAALLRSLGDEPTLEDQKDPENLLTHILTVLKDCPVRLQIDSMERLLRGNDQEGWSEFCDPLWLNLFQRILTTGDCQSQIILTTQDIPENLAYEGSRYDALWYCEPVRGLNETEQLELFAKRGIVGAHSHAPNAEHQAPPNDPALGGQPSGGQPSAPMFDASGSAKQPETLDCLKRIGRIYDGHPLVLRVIAEDIKTCGGDVARYWQQCHFDDLEAHKPTRFSRRKLQREVERRVKTALESLPNDALQLLCRASVYRRPVPRAFWLGLMPDIDPDQGDALLDLLESRGFATEDWEPGAWLGADGEIPLRQHNLIRNMAYSLLQADKLAWETAHRQAADRWLTVYKPTDEIPNLEKVRGLFEGFHYYCQLEDWEKACHVLDIPIDSPTHEPFHWQLETWGYWREEIQLYHQVLGKTSKLRDCLWFRGLGLTHRNLGNTSRAIHYHQQSLAIAREIGDRSGESKALSNLGIAYYNLGQYHQAIDSHRQALVISREIGDRRGEGQDLGSLGIAHHSLGQYHQAIGHHQQYLAIAREIGDRQGESAALGNLGLAYSNLGQYHQAIDFHQQYLAIAREIGDRRGEGNALGSLGIAYDSLEQHHLAIDFHQQYLAIAREIGDRKGEGNALGSLGIAYDSLEQYHLAIDFHQQHMAIAREIGDRNGEGIALENLGATLIKLERYQEAFKSLQIALGIYRETSFRAGESEALKLYAELHQKLGEREQAISYCEQALALSTELGIPLKTECEALLSELEQGESS